MKNDFIKLYNDFLKIKQKGYVKSKRKGSTGIGYTFESLLNIEENSLPISDFNEIEIKTLRNNSKKILHLFNATPDGDYLFPIKRIHELLAYKDRNNPNYKVFNMSFNSKEFTNIGYYKRGKLLVDYSKKKVNFIVLNQDNKDLNVNISWSFDLIKEKIDYKIKNLAIINADSKFENKEEYFHYNQIRFYKFKNFENFIKFIDNGNIVITFKIGVFKNGERKGQIHDRGTDFSICLCDINKLYEPVFITDVDLGQEV